MDCPDTKSIAVTEFLLAIVKAQSCLYELADKIRSYPDVENVQIHHFVVTEMTQHHWDEEQQKQAVGSDFGVSAQLKDGAVVDWWLEMRSEEGHWYVDANVYKSDVNEDGSHTIMTCGERQALALDDAIEQLSKTVTALTTPDAVRIPFHSQRLGQTA